MPSQIARRTELVGVGTAGGLSSSRLSSLLPRGLTTLEIWSILLTRSLSCRLLLGLSLPPGEVITTLGKASGAVSISVSKATGLRASPALALSEEIFAAAATGGTDAILSGIAGLSPFESPESWTWPVSSSRNLLPVFSSGPLCERTLSRPIAWAMMAAAFFARSTLSESLRDSQLLSEAQSESFGSGAPSLWSRGTMPVELMNSTTSAAESEDLTVGAGLESGVLAWS